MMWPGDPEGGTPSRTAGPPGTPQGVTHFLGRGVWVHSPVFPEREIVLRRISMRNASVSSEFFRAGEGGREGSCDFWRYPLRGRGGRGNCGGVGGGAPLPGSVTPPMGLISRTGGMGCGFGGMGAGRRTTLFGP